MKAKVSNMKNAAALLTSSYDSEAIKLQQLREEKTHLVQALATVREKIAQLARGVKTTKNKASSVLKNIQMLKTTVGSY